MPPPDHRPGPGREPITEIMGVTREPPLLSGYGTSPRVYDTAPMATLRKHPRAAYWLLSAVLAAASAFVLLVLPGLREPIPKGAGSAVPESSSVQPTTTRRPAATRPTRTTPRSTPVPTRSLIPPSTTATPPPPTSTSLPLLPSSR